jgi:DNA-binding NtrC family response regulator
MNTATFLNSVDSSPATPRVWIVEDEAKWQEAFQLLAGMAFNTPVVFQVADSVEATQPWLLLNAKQSEPHWPDVLLMDWQLAHGGDGLRLVEAWIQKGLPADRVIIVSGSTDVPPHPFRAVNKSQAGRLLIPTIFEMLTSHPTCV